MMMVNKQAADSGCLGRYTVRCECLTRSNAIL